MSRCRWRIQMMLFSDVEGEDLEDVIKEADGDVDKK